MTQFLRTSNLNFFSPPLTLDGTKIYIFFFPNQLLLSRLACGQTTQTCMVMLSTFSSFLSICSVCPQVLSSLFSKYFLNCLSHFHDFYFVPSLPLPLTSTLVFQVNFTASPACSGGFSGSSLPVRGVLQLLQEELCCVCLFTFRCLNYVQEIR